MIISKIEQGYSPTHQLLVGVAHGGVSTQELHLTAPRPLIHGGDAFVGGQAWDVNLGGGQIVGRIT